MSLQNILQPELTLLCHKKVQLSDILRDFLPLTRKVCRNHSMISLPVCFLMILQMFFRWSNFV